jgi:hypothetical protein
VGDLVEIALHLSHALFNQCAAPRGQIDGVLKLSLRRQKGQQVVLEGTITDLVSMWTVFVGILQFLKKREYMLQRQKDKTIMALLCRGYVLSILK